MNRITFDGEAIGNKIQTEKCGYCGMGLCDPREWHPHPACEEFLRTHDSRDVWRLLWRLLKARDDQVAGAVELHHRLYPKATA